VAPEFREYERTSTTVVNAYLGPIMKRYIDRLDGRLRDLGLATAPHLTQSNGGVTSFETAAELPVRTVLSGPSTGVVAAQEIGRRAGMLNLITFDMGGTSSDVALLRNGVCAVSNSAVVHGYPIIAPMLDIHTVGAGGGSIAHIDAGGLLKVGPRSAGANPGPVCYGLGNDEPTVTDANVVMQTLNPTHLLDGRMAIDRSLSVAAVERLAGRLGLDLMAAASGIISVVTANMARAIRVISIQRGYDPRQYALTAFGGAGPLHAARLARELQMTSLLVPRMPGVLCAVGLLLTDLRANFSRTNLVPMTDTTPESLEESFSGLMEDARRWFEAEGVLPESRALSRVVDMRYEGQNYELSVPLPGDSVTAESLKLLERGFLAAHHRLYGFTADGDALQIVTVRVEATGLVRKAEFPEREPAATPVEDAVAGYRDVYFPEAGGFVNCPVYARDRLGYGHRFEGPAIVEQMDATTVVLPGMTARIDTHLNLILEDAQ